MPRIDPVTRITGKVTAMGCTPNGNWWMMVGGRRLSMSAEMTMLVKQHFFFRGPTYTPEVTVEFDALQQATMVVFVDQRWEHCNHATD